MLSCNKGPGIHPRVLHRKCWWTKSVTLTPKTWWVCEKYHHTLQGSIIKYFEDSTSNQYNINSRWPISNIHPISNTSNIQIYCHSFWEVTESMWLIITLIIQVKVLFHEVTTLWSQPKGREAKIEQLADRRHLFDVFTYHYATEKSIQQLTIFLQT